MGIQALPSATVRTLGASQAITDPATVVKELLDNALDAGATSVAIEISNNTVDSIQVRDNGHGIPLEDRRLVAKAHCTSKIGGEEDLKTIGGTSLGFRGEALASIAELSETLTVSTRVEGEQVATSLKINQQGEVVGQERASLPVGTTVKITGFVKAYPVRNQNALRNCEKYLRQIKQTLQSYAFARPEVRLSLKVLKAKTDKLNWTYAPKAGGNVEDAALKIVGSACASQCVWSVLEDQDFTLQAFSPNFDAEPGKISNFGSFLSIDHRPVSTARGTPKQINKNFREAFKAGDEKFAGVKDPFMYLNIDCPSASYDANVEPAKDDVLFENPEVVIAAARALFERAYPSKAQEAPSEGHAANATRPAPVEARPVAEDDFYTSLEAPFRNPAFSSPRYGTASVIPHETLQQLINESNNDSNENQRPTRNTFRSNMYGCDEDDLDLIDASATVDYSEADFAELRQIREDVSVSNPWTLAKMHAASRRPPEEFRRNEPPQASFGLPTPRPSSPTPPSHPIDFNFETANLHREVDARRIGSHSLPPSQMMLAPRGSSQEPAHEESSRPRPAPAYDYKLSSQATDPHAGTPLSAIPEARQRQRPNAQKRLQQTQINKPFLSPLPNRPPGERVWFDHLENIEGSQQRRSNRKRAPQYNGGNGLVNQGELGDLIEDPRSLTPPRRNRDMRDFVTRVDLTGAEDVASFVEARNFVRPQTECSTVNEINEELPTAEIVDRPAAASSLSNSLSFMRASERDQTEDQDQLVNLTEPPKRASKRRKTNEARPMREISGNARSRDGNDDEDIQPIASNRAASHRRRTSDGVRLRRTKSANLPLERVPAGQGTHDLVRTVESSLGEIMRVADVVDYDNSVLSWHVPAADIGDAFSGLVTSTEMQDLTMRLHKLLVERVSDGEMVQDLGRLVESAMTKRSEALHAAAVLA